MSGNLLKAPCIYIYIYIYIYIIKLKHCFLLIGWVNTFLIFRYYESQFGSTRCFYQSHEMLNWPYTLQMLLAGFASSAWSTASESIVKPYSTLPDCWGSFSSSEISSTILLLYCDQIMPSSFAQQMFFVVSAAFKSHTVGNNAQHVSASTTMILLITTGTFHGLNCFPPPPIYALQTSTRVRTTKILQNLWLTLGELYKFS